MTSFKTRADVPKKIYLQWKNDEGELLVDDEITWCEERLYKFDIAYLKACVKTKCLAKQKTISRRILWQIVISALKRMG